MQWGKGACKGSGKGSMWVCADRRCGTPTYASKLQCHGCYSARPWPYTTVNGTQCAMAAGKSKGKGKGEKTFVEQQIAKQDASGKQQKAKKTKEKKVQKKKSQQHHANAEAELQKMKAQYKELQKRMDLASSEANSAASEHLAAAVPKVQLPVDTVSLKFMGITDVVEGRDPLSYVQWPTRP